MSLDGKYSQSSKKWRGAAPLLAGAALLAGCGGGGSSNGNSLSGGPTSTTSTTGTNSGIIPPPVSTTPDSSVTGRIVDTTGAGVPGVSVIADTGGTVTSSLSKGGYRLDVTSGVVHRIIASVVRNNITYSGSTQVLTFSQGLTSNANIILSDAGRQASVSGTVVNAAGQALAGARVSVAATGAGPASSLTAFTNNGGNYTLPSIPVDIASTASLTLAVTAPGYQGQTVTLGNPGAGGAANQSFTLLPSTQQAVQPPALSAAFAFTEPTSSLSGSVRQARVQGQPSPYEALRRRLSPAYARLAGQRGARGTRRTSRATGTYAVETDLDFDQSAQTGSVLDYDVYRTSGTALPALPALTYDSVQDPLANYYTDLTFSNFSKGTQAGVQYNFALTVRNTDYVETALSAPLSITPLGPLTLTAPLAGASAANPVAVSWSPVTGATSYHVFLYTGDPTTGTSPEDLGATPMAATSVSLPALTVGQTYYVVVVGQADQTESAAGVTPAVTITNAVQTYSQITQFTVTK